MALILARANLTIVGQQLVWGQEYDLPPDDPEVVACIAAGYLTPKGEDGTYPEARVEPRRGCCGS